MKQVFFLSHFDLGFADLQCKIQNWIFQLRSSKSNRQLAQIIFLSHRWRRIYHQRKPPFLINVCKRWKILGGNSQTTLTSFWVFLTTYPHYVDMFYLITVDKKSTFLDYPLLLVNVVCERPLIVKCTWVTEKGTQFIKILYLLSILSWVRDMLVYHRKESINPYFSRLLDAPRLKTA